MLVIRVGAVGSANQENRVRAAHATEPVHGGVSKLLKPFVSDTVRHPHHLSEVCPLIELGAPVVSRDIGAVESICVELGSLEMDRDRSVPKAALQVQGRAFGATPARYDQPWFSP